MNNKKKLIISKAYDLGFETVGFTEPKISLIDQNNLTKFLENNLFGHMKWLERHAIKKKNPKKLWSKVKTVIVLGLNYAPEINPLNKNLFKNNANISVYASNEDYHIVIKKKLLFLQEWLESELNIESKYFVIQRLGIKDYPHFGICRIIFWKNMQIFSNLKSFYSSFLGNHALK